MDEREIETIAEKRMNILDAVYLNGRLHSNDYTRKVKELNDWSEEQYRLLKTK